MIETDKTIDIVIQGSGVKASAALGAIVELHDAGYTFARMSGTSSGAMVAALVMAYQKSGRDMHDLLGVMTSIDYDKIATGTVLGLAEGGLDILRRGGASNGQYLKNIVAESLAPTGVTTFGDFRIDDPGSSLPSSQSYSVLMHATDITRRAWVRMPWDYGEYGLNPDDQLIADAVVASMAFPVIFDPVDITTGDGQQVTWIDGGAIANYPMTTFDRTDGKPSRWPTYGIRMFGRPGSETGVVHGLPHILLNSFMSMLEWNRYGDEPGQTLTQITVQTGPDDVPNELNFNITPAERTALYDKGRQATRDFLSGKGTATQ